MQKNTQVKKIIKKNQVRNNENKQIPNAIWRVAKCGHLFRTV